MLTKFLFWQMKESVGNGQRGRHTHPQLHQVILSAQPGSIDGAAKHGKAVAAAAALQSTQIDRAAEHAMRRRVHGHLNVLNGLLFTVFDLTSRIHAQPKRREPLRTTRS